MIFQSLTVFPLMLRYLDTRECSYNPCENGGTCYMTGYGKDQEQHCVCRTSFSGDYCEKGEEGETRHSKLTIFSVRLRACVIQNNVC